MDKKPSLPLNGLHPPMRSPTGRTGRLPSFKKPPDLTLGGPSSSSRGGASGAAGTARKFVPNLNVQRAKKGELEAKPEMPVETKRFGKGAKQLQDAKGKAKGRPELIQTMGSVFSDGLSAEGIRRKATSGGFGVKTEQGDGDGFGRSARTVVKMDKEEEDRRLQALLRDDFIDDLGVEGFFVPVQLPMINTGKVFNDQKQDASEDDDLHTSQLMRTRKKQHQILDSDDEDDAKMQVDAESKAGGAESAEVKDRSFAGKATQELSFPDLVKNQKGDLLFIQLPDHLPGSFVAKKEVDVSIKEETGQACSTGAASVKASAPSISNCTLQDLPEGYLGKIQIRRSGKTQLKIGDDLFDIDLGVQVGFLQDLVSIRTAENDPRIVGDMTVLGHVKHRIVLTPDWDSLFQSRDMKKS